MKIFCISDTEDTKVGFCLGGMEGALLTKKEDILNCLEDILHRTSEIAVVAITMPCYQLVQQEVEQMIKDHPVPLIITVPSR